MLGLKLKGTKILTLIDAEDFEKVKQYDWYLLNGRAVCRTPEGLIHLSRLVMDAPKDFLVDHRNLNSLDNRKENLRLCTRSQNRMNTGLCASNTSGRKGVYWSKQRKKWQAQVRKNGKNIYLGLFNTVEEAGKAYDKGAKEIFGEFARINEI